MSMWLAFKRYFASLGGHSFPQLLARLLLALMLSACLGAALGAGLAYAAPHQPAVSPSLSFSGPNTRGLIGGPPGVNTTVRGFSWSAYSSVQLYVRPGTTACASGVSIGTFPTDANGSFAAHFLWPAAANQLASYHACGVQSGKGIFYSHNTFVVLATSAPTVAATPTSAIAGNSLTVTGGNWVPGPQTINLILLPCSTLCNERAVATGQVVTAQDGSFSLQMTIAADAASGTYYLQATNGQATLSAVSSAIQVTGLGQAGGTPVAGISPTSGATRSGQGGADGTSPKANNTLPALKAALVAAALGIAALAALIGGGILVLRVTRSGGAIPKGRRPAPRLVPDQASRKPPAPEWRSASRGGYPASRPALPPVSGQVRREPEDEPAPEVDIWEGEARTATDPPPLFRAHRPKPPHRAPPDDQG